MESFFYICRQDAPEVIDTLASRYGWTIPQIEATDIRTLAETLKVATEKTRRGIVYSEWVALQPFMIIQWLKWMSFDDYYTRRTGGDIDMRPAEEILAEVAEVKKWVG